jgi:hypothetical protein
LKPETVRPRPRPRPVRMPVGGGVELHDHEVAKLDTVSRRTGHKRGVLLGIAIDLLADIRQEELRERADRVVAKRQAFG